MFSDGHIVLFTPFICTETIFYCPPGGGWTSPVQRQLTTDYKSYSGQQQQLTTVLTHCCTGWWITGIGYNYMHQVYKTKQLSYFFDLLAPTFFSIYVMLHGSNIYHDQKRVLSRFEITIDFVLLFPNCPRPCECASISLKKTLMKQTVGCFNF